MRAVYCLAHILFLFFWYGCKPNTSDFEVETIDTAYVNNLPTIADTMIAVAPSQKEKMLGIVKGWQYQIGGNQKEMLLWFDEQGKVVSMTEKRMGILVDSVAFFPNGQRMFRITFDHKGIAEGNARYFFSDGRIRQDGLFANGIKTGVWRSFNEAGKLQETHEFDRFGRKIR
jgi:antitoxin component YwqK of YwqJK toxin-antitoxin module